MFYRHILKRVFDFLLAVGLLILLFIPMCIVGIIIKLTSKGPVLFIQERYGRYSQPFELYKFRSMVYNAPQRANAEFNNITNYITPFGMFIRKTSLDELPQLWNIIRGDMSFIGPRPLAVTDIRVIELRKLNGADQVLPGISGLAQASGRNNISDEDKAMYDAMYANNLSLRLDMLLIWKTVITVIRHDGVFKDSDPD